ncbi:MAG: phage major capsid protein [Oscillospiraceae bacterium]|nr:phage major capsid protein [Oscillospiraceae bacterium]
MADILSKGALFPEELIPDLIQKTTGSSALAQLCAASPIPFNGMREFTFQLDKEIDVVAENGAKSIGGVTVTPVTIVPIKVEYGARVSDEFVYASETVQMDYLSAFSDGFARKVARGIDLMAFHGINPRTATASSVIGDNNFDSVVTQIVTIADETAPDGDVESAIALVQDSDHDVTGIAMAPAFRSALAAQTYDSGVKLYPELAWGNAPGTLNGLAVASNSTLSANSSLDRALVGDFTNFFRWGYAKEIPIEVIRYGNPDNDETMGDLKGHNQVYLRGEMYLGWGILDATAFALIQAAE